MPKYHVAQYEIHIASYFVEANTPAEAIHKVWNGSAEMGDDAPEYSEPADAFGIPCDENPDLVKGLRELGEKIPERHIPSIASVTCIDHH